MEARRSTWEAAIRLAVTLSVLAAMTAVVLRSIGILSQTTIVLGVIVVGFAASWVRTGQVEPRRLPAQREQRAVTVRVHGAHSSVS